MIKEFLDPAEYNAIYDEEQEFHNWMQAQEQQDEAHRAAITMQRGRDRFLFDTDAVIEQFSPYNTSNS